MNGEHGRPLPRRHCDACGKRLHLKRYASGLLESRTNYETRRNCDRACMGAAARARSRRRPIRAHETKPPCGVPACDRLARSKGLCLMHYQRARRHGSPLAPRMKPGPKPRYAARVGGIDHGT